MTMMLLCKGLQVFYNSGRAQDEEFLCRFMASLRKDGSLWGRHYDHQTKEQ